MQIPFGKHVGKTLDDLNYAQVHWMYWAWNDKPSLRRTDFFRHLEDRFREMEPPRWFPGSRFDNGRGRPVDNPRPVRSVGRPQVKYLGERQCTDFGLEPALESDAALPWE